MEKVGTGIRRVRKFCRENNNAIDIKPGDTYFSVEMKSPVVVPAVDETINQNGGINGGKKLSKNQQAIIKTIFEVPDITLEILAQKAGIPLRSVERNIAELKERGILRRIGSRKTGYWDVKTSV
jgi:ATP-dependent DNA helicase RecG